MVDDLPHLRRKEVFEGDRPAAANQRRVQTVQPIPGAGDRTRRQGSAEGQADQTEQAAGTKICPASVSAAAINSGGDRSNT